MDIKERMMLKEGFKLLLTISNSMKTISAAPLEPINNKIIKQIKTCMATAIRVCITIITN